MNIKFIINNKEEIYESIFRNQRQRCKHSLRANSLDKLYQKSE